MNQLKSKISKRKKIRKFLLINSDIEMQKKIKAKNYILINSMTPIELENLFQLYKNPINSISTFTNVKETHMIQKIVDIPNNIDYFFSDLIDNKKDKMKKRFMYQQLYSTKNFIVNYNNLLNDKEEKEKEKNHHNDEMGEHIIPFVSKKKSVGQEKINNNKIYPLITIGQKNIFQNVSDINNIGKIEEEVKNSSCECGSKNKEECDKCNEKKNHKKKTLDLNYKLVYYCYTHLKRKRPLNTKMSDNATILGLEVEEEMFSKNKNNNQLNLKKCKSSKHVKNTNSESIEKKDIININDKRCNEKRNTMIIKYKHNHNENDRKQNIQATEYDKLMIKRLGKKLQSIRSETNRKRESKRLSLIVKSKKRANSIIKKFKSINKNKRKTPTQIIISKADTKNSSFDNMSSENFSSLKNKNKKRINNIHLHKKNELINSNKKKNKPSDKIIFRKDLKYSTQHRVKNVSQEEMKIREKIKLKRHKKTNDPQRDKNVSFLIKYGEFNQQNDLKESKIKIFKNNIRNSIKKVKSFKCKSNKDCLNYNNNLNDENDFLHARIKSNVSISNYFQKGKKKETSNMKKKNYK